VAQPNFIPVSEAATVRPSMTTATPEIGRAKKPGLLGTPSVHGGLSHGTPGPDAGYALTLAERASSSLTSIGISHHDLVLGIALVASRRAGRAGRAPTMRDVEVAIDLFALRSKDPDAHRDAVQRFAGIAHSYAKQRQLVDAVSDRALDQVPGEVTALVRLAPEE
jgi:hypothetical protein